MTTNELLRGEPDATTLRAARRARNLTQAQLARAARVDAAVISRVERGVEIPRPSVRARLAAALNLDPASITDPLR